MDGEDDCLLLLWVVVFSTRDVNVVVVTNDEVVPKSSPVNKRGSTVRRQRVAAMPPLIFIGVYTRACLGSIERGKEALPRSLTIVLLTLIDAVMIDV